MSERGIRFEDVLKKQLEDPEFAREFEKAKASSMDDVQIRRIPLREVREALKITQKDLSGATGVTQADISKIERGYKNPSLKTLRRLAAGMDMDVEIRFVPRPKSD